MSTAVIISGQVRTFASCLPTLQHHVFRRLSDPHFFCSVADENQASDIYLLESLYPGKVHVERVTQPDLTLPGETRPATSNLAESQRHRLAQHAPYAISSSLQAILRQLWAMDRAWAFFQFECKSYPANTPTGDWLGMFNTIVRCRPDLWFQSFEMPRLPPSINPWGNPNSWPRDILSNEAFLPWWARCGGVNDRFGIMGADAARRYFTAYQQIPAALIAGCPLHPESLVAESLRMGGVVVGNTLNATFQALRQDGTRVQPREYPGELAAFIAASR